jgi:hypothetical protein
MTIEILSFSEVLFLPSPYFCFVSKTLALASFYFLRLLRAAEGATGAKESGACDAFEGSQGCATRLLTMFK